MPLLPHVGWCIRQFRTQSMRICWGRRWWHQAAKSRALPGRLLVSAFCVSFRRCTSDSNLTNLVPAGTADILAVNIGAEMLKIVPGRVSTEVDAHLSHDTQATVDRALKVHAHGDACVAAHVYACRDTFGSVRQSCYMPYMPCTTLMHPCGPPSPMRYLTGYPDPDPTITTFVYCPRYCTWALGNAGCHRHQASTRLCTQLLPPCCMPLTV
jgi:hypothetical protein